MSNKKAIGKLIGFIAFVFVVILLIFLIKNNWDFPAAVNSMLSLFGKK